MAEAAVATDDLKKPTPSPTDDVEAPQIAPEAQPMPSLGTPTPPESVLGTEVAPGQQIPPEKMKQAEHLAVNPKAEEEFKAEQDRHNTMRQFGEQRKALNAASMASLDPNNPNYVKELGAHLGQKAMLMADEGALDRAEARYKQEHPWGTMGNHPGIGGKIGHAFGVMGNVVGNATLGPQNMALIPSSQANLAAKAHAGATEEAEGAKQGQEAAATEATQAEVPVREAQASKLGQEETNLENKTDKTQNKILHETDQGLFLVDPDSKEVTPLTYQGKPLMPKAAKESGRDQDISDYLAANKLPDSPENRETARKAIATRAQQPREPNPFAEWRKENPNGSVEDYLKASAGARADVPTAATRTMAEAAPKVKYFVARIQPLIDKLATSGELGPGAGRWNEFWTGKVGTKNPEFTKLRTDVGLLTTLLMRMHVGARGGEYIMQHFSDLINSGKQDPDNMRAALGEIGSYADQIIGGGNESTSNKGGANTPSKKQWNAKTGRYE